MRQTWVPEAEGRIMLWGISQVPPSCESNCESLPANLSVWLGQGTHNPGTSWGRTKFISDCANIPQVPAGSPGSGHLPRFPQHRTSSLGKCDRPKLWRPECPATVMIPHTPSGACWTLPALQRKWVCISRLLSPPCVWKENRHGRKTHKQWQAHKQKQNTKGCVSKGKKRNLPRRYRGSGLNLHE